jgi:hypothetical protein
MTETVRRRGHLNFKTGKSESRMREDAMCKTCGCGGKK